MRNLGLLRGIPLQNIPFRTEEGKAAAEALRRPVDIAVQYSDIELRIMADLGVLPQDGSVDLHGSFERVYGSRSK